MNIKRQFVFQKRNSELFAQKKGFPRSSRSTAIHRLRSYILGKNEAAITTNGNTEHDDTPGLSSVTNNQHDITIDDSTDKLEQQSDTIYESGSAEQESLQYDALEHMAGYICHRTKNPKNCVNDQANPYTWTYQLSEGFLRKPTDEFMSALEKIQISFNIFSGNDSLLCI